MTGDWICSDFFMHAYYRYYSLISDDAGIYGILRSDHGHGIYPENKSHTPHASLIMAPVPSTETSANISFLSFVSKKAYLDTLNYRWACTV